MEMKIEIEKKQFDQEIFFIIGDLFPTVVVCTPYGCTVSTMTTNELNKMLCEKSKNCKYQSK